MTANNLLEPFKKIRVKAAVFVLLLLFSVTVGEPALKIATTAPPGDRGRVPLKDIAMQVQPPSGDTGQNLKIKMGPA